MNQHLLRLLILNVATALFFSQTIATVTTPLADQPRSNYAKYKAGIFTAIAAALVLDRVANKDKSLIPSICSFLQWLKQPAKYGRWHDIKRYVQHNKVTVLLILSALIGRKHVSNWLRAKVAGHEGLKKPILSTRVGQAQGYINTIVPTNIPRFQGPNSVANEVNKVTNAAIHLLRLLRKHPDPYIDAHIAAHLAHITTTGDDLGHFKEGRSCNRRRPHSRALSTTLRRLLARRISCMYRSSLPKRRLCYSCACSPLQSPVRSQKVHHSGSNRLPNV